MASILKVDDLRGNTSAGNITITSEGGAATQSLQQGLAKAWTRFVGTGTVTVNDSLNVSSITDNGSGWYVHNYTNSFSSVNFSAMGTSNWNGVVTHDTPYASDATTFLCRDSSSTSRSDRGVVTTSMHGDLA